ncbi:MAG: hypothetical protein WAW37_12910 [Syntrophobacteraceae bacterium]
MKLNRKLLVCTVLFLFVLLGGLIPAQAEEKAAEPPKAAEAPKPTATVTTDILNQYVFRGLALSQGNSAVIQPGFTAAYMGFSLNIWGNFDTHEKTHNPNLIAKHNGDAAWNETDITTSYTRELFPNFSATVGNVYYSLVNSTYDTDEVFFGGAYTFPWLTVGMTAYREVLGHFPGWWVQLDLTKSFPLPYIEGMSLDVGATFGYMIMEDSSKTVLNLDGRTGEYSEPHSGTIQAALKIPFCKYFTVAPKVGVAFPLSDTASEFIKANSFDKDDVHVFGGINLTASF